MSTQSANTRRIPNPIYAAAGAGDLAYRQLSEFGRQLPTSMAGAAGLASALLASGGAKAQELRGKVAALRPVVTDAVTDAVVEPARRVDVDRLRVVARRNAVALVSQAVTQAQVVQERAATVYADLVARGERIVGGPYKELEPAGDLVDVDYPPADQPSAHTTSAASESGPGTGRSPARAIKKTRPTAVK